MVPRRFLLLVSLLCGLPAATAGVPCGPDGAPCDDGDACTQSDACAAGQCRGAPAFLVAERARVGNDSTVGDDIAVNGPGGSLALGRRTFMPDDTVAAADSLRLGLGASVANAAFNRLNHGAAGAGTVRGAQQTPLALPLVQSLAALPPVDCGAPEVVVPRGETAGPLAPGAYGPLLVQSDGTLALAPGAFSFCSIRTGRRAAIETTGEPPATIAVRDAVRLGASSRLGPALGAPTPVLQVAGARVRLAHGVRVDAFLHAPGALLKLGRAVALNGTAHVELMLTGRRVELACAPAVACGDVVCAPGETCLAPGLCFGTLP